MCEGSRRPCDMCLRLLSARTRYDMAFDARWATFNMVESLAQQLGLIEQLEEGGDGESDS